MLKFDIWIPVVCSDNYKVGWKSLNMKVKLLEFYSLIRVIGVNAALKLQYIGIFYKVFAGYCDLTAIKIELESN